MRNPNSIWRGVMDWLVIRPKVAGLLQFKLLELGCRQAAKVAGHKPKK